MKFDIDVKELKDALNAIYGFIPTKSTFPVITHVALEVSGNNLGLSGTNLEQACKVPVLVNGEEDGSITVPYKVLLELVRTFPDDKLFVTSDDPKVSLRLVCGKDTVNIKGLDFQEFPPVKEPEEKDVVFTIESELLSRVLTATMSSTARPGDGRMVLEGVYTRFVGDTFTVAATDGFRLSEYTYTSNGDGNIGWGVAGKENRSFATILPKNTVKNIGKIGRLHSGKRVCVHLEKEHLCFNFGDSFLLRTTTIQGNFPDYSPVIPKEDKIKCSIERSRLLSSLKLAKVFTKDSRKATFRFKGNKLFISGASSELGDNTVELSVTPMYEFGDFAINLDPDNIDDVLRNFSGENVIFRGTTKFEAVAINSEPGDQLLVVMPLHPEGIEDE